VRPVLLEGRVLSTSSHAEPINAPTSPHGYKDAVADAASIERLWRAHPGPLIGVWVVTPHSVIGHCWQRITVSNNDWFDDKVGHSRWRPSVVFYVDGEPNTAVGIELADARRWMGNLHTGALDLSVM
jgi:hypothetical protein